MMMAEIGTTAEGYHAFFRFRAVGEHVVVTSLDGSFVTLDQSEFRAFAKGEVGPAHPLYARLVDANLLRSSFDVHKATERLRRRKSFMRQGPNLHILVVTLRCNETCVYCHASRAPMHRTDTDMSPQTAEHSIDLAFESTSPSITIEFQGGEPLVNFPVIKHSIEYALKRNETFGKELSFCLVSNLAAMDDEKLAYLTEKHVQISTSVDGPADLHDSQRKLVGGSAHAQAVHWIKRINESYVAQGLDPNLYHVEALVTTTRATLPRWKELVDTYVGLGCRALFLRPLDPFGFADRTKSMLEYPIEDYLAYYRSAVDYMIELNRNGTQILERFAGIFLTKILSGEDPNYLDIRSPCGAGIGQLAYNYDGKIFTCDEGRMLHEMGDESFLIGEVKKDTYRGLVGHETVRTIALASNLDQQPDCPTCAYQPYCGVCPVYNHRTQGNLFGHNKESALCAAFMGIQDYLFEKLASGDPEVRAVLERWTTARPRTHFVHGCG